MTRDEIEKALDSIVEDFFIKRRIIDFALACCARQAEEDAKIAEINGDDIETMACIASEIRANAPTCGELSRTKVDK